jgi:molecular chaperone IbpA
MKPRRISIAAEAGDTTKTIEAQVAPQQVN